MDEYITEITETISGRIPVTNICVGSGKYACFLGDENFLVRCEMNDDFFDYYMRRDRVCFGNNVNIMEVVMQRFSPRLFLKMMEMISDYCTGIHAYRYSTDTLFIIYRGIRRGSHRFTSCGWIPDDYFKQRKFNRVDDDTFIYIENPVDQNLHWNPPNSPGCIR